MDILQKYIDIGLKLGLEGQDLRDFISDRERIGRDDRHAIRERCHDLWSWIWVHFDYFIISRFLYTKIICTF